MFLVRARGKRVRRRTTIAFIYDGWFIYFIFLIYMVCNKIPPAFNLPSASTEYYY